MREAVDIKQAQRGDRAAFGRLYDALLPGVYGYARARLPSTEQAEDVVSSTFLDVLDNLASFRWRGSGSLRAWVYRILRNHIADFYRRTSRQQEVPLRQAEGRSSSGPSDDYSASEEKWRLLDSITQLSPRQQEVIQLRYFGELRNKEIAVVLGLDERTVAAYLSRGLQSLEQQLMLLEEDTHAG